MNQSFNWPILGHEQIKKYLQSCIINGTLVHAYLFCGPRHIGKFFIANCLAGSILCQANNDKKPCQKCIPCQQFSKKIHADVSVIDKFDDKNNILIDQIRDLQYKLSLKSFLTSYKIAIIDRAEFLTIKAANALLKTLEEPTPKTIIILITEKKELLPDTIISRCQTIQFNSISKKQIANWLIKKGKNKQNAKIIASLANGRPGLANLLMADNSLIEKRAARIDLIFRIIGSDLNSKFNIINSLVGKSSSIGGKEQYIEILEDWQTFFRDMLLTIAKANDIININYKDKLQKSLKKLNTKRIIDINSQITYAKKMLYQSVSPKLILENLALNL